MWWFSSPAAVRLIFINVSLILLVVCKTKERSVRLSSKGLQGAHSNGFQGDSDLHGNSNHGDGFGYDVDSSDDFLVIGCPNDLANGKWETGTATIYPFTQRGNEIGSVWYSYRIPPFWSMPLYT